MKGGVPGGVWLSDAYTVVLQFGGVNWGGRGGGGGRGRRKKERMSLQNQIRSKKPCLHSNQTARYPRRRKKVRVSGQNTSLKKVETAVFNVLVVCKPFCVFWCCVPKRHK